MRAKTLSCWHQYLDECPPWREEVHAVSMACRTTGFPQVRSVPTDSGHSVRVLLDPAARLEPGARWVHSETDQYTRERRTQFSIATALTISRPQCMVGPCVAREFCRSVGLRSCINVSDLRLERAVLRAIMEISAHTFSLNLQTSVGHCGRQVWHAP